MTYEALKVCGLGEVIMFKLRQVNANVKWNDVSFIYVL